MHERLARIALHYIQRCRPNADAELDSFKHCSSKAAIERAGLAEDENGRRFNHQRRIPRKLLLESRRRLLDAKQKLNEVQTFEELHGYVESTIGMLKGIGRLTIYDTALRIAANRGLQPNVVYLHAGTLKGAKHLGLYKGDPVLSLGEIPKPLRRLKPFEIEDVLCIYKDCFLCKRKECTLTRKTCDDKRSHCLCSVINLC